jgi:hypothetical protein
MKPTTLILALTLLSVSAQGQSTTGSVSGRLATHQNKHQHRLDSLASLESVSRWRDSLTIKAWSDSLTAKVNRRFSPDFLTRRADSLRLSGVPEPAILRQTDSLVSRKLTLLAEVSDKQSRLQRKVSDRYTTWTDNLREKFNLDSAGFTLPIGPANPQSGDLTGPPPTIPDVGDTGFGTMPGLQAADFASVDVSPELSAIGGDLTLPTVPQLGEWQKSMPVMPEPMNEVNRQLAGVKELANDPSKAAENALGQVSEVSDATRTLKEAEDLKKQSEALQAAESIKSPGAAAEVAKQQAVDHFAGKEAEVQAAMNQMAKYKKKYSSLGSLSEMKKNDWLPRNGLKGKPFKERFRPGLGMGLRNGGDTLLFDFFPGASYRITGRFEAGLAAIYRVRVVTDPFGFDQRNPVWGLASFVVIKTFKSVFVRLQTDGNSFPVSGSVDRPPYRDWRWSFHAGVQTNFKLSKRLTGNVQMLYNFDSSLKDAFPEKLSARVGVVYSIK